MEIDRYRVEMTKCSNCEHKPSDTNWFSHNQLNLVMICESCNEGLHRVTKILQKLTIQVIQGGREQNEQLSAWHAN